MNQSGDRIKPKHRKNEKKMETVVAVVVTLLAVLIFSNFSVYSQRTRLFPFLRKRVQRPNQVVIRASRVHKVLKKFFKDTAQETLSVRSTLFRV